ncbi:hypothetical protein B0T20DRAFT_494984 [Sordaria brevicollis]|uniref:Uncharacterized protein n=1 Tax=Sordaria brevicollis TaxID=83679 RepID=A0AAE0UE63_SORBR|nr:hypothetical protein B0T20DRAFT_494984 [Sordaria brevicollis]
MAFRPTTPVNGHYQQPTDHSELDGWAFRCLDESPEPEEDNGSPVEEALRKTTTIKCYASISDVLIDTSEEDHVYGRLDEWARRLDEKHNKGNRHVLGEVAGNATCAAMHGISDVPIHASSQDDVYSRLDEWATSLNEHATIRASIIDKTSKPIDNKHTDRLIDIDAETPIVYGPVEMFDQQADDIHGPFYLVEERLPEPEPVMKTPSGTTDNDDDISHSGEVAPKTTKSTVEERFPAPKPLKPSFPNPSNCADDVFYDGDGDVPPKETTEATTALAQPFAHRISISLPRPTASTPSRSSPAMKLQSPEDFINYRRLSPISFDD